MFGKEFLASAAGLASLQHADEIYSALFKAGDFTLAEHPEMFDSLVAYHMEPTYAPFPQINSHEAELIMMRRHDDEDGDDEDEDEEFDDCSDDFPEPVIIAEGLSRADAEALVKVSTYSWLCNYKGEADGQEFALKEKVAHLQTFHSKWNYSN
jgi:hypothetical protein